jgi:hypothetical protein
MLLYRLDFSNCTEKVEISGTCSMQGEDEKCIQNFDLKTSKRFKEPYHRSEYNIKMDAREMVC